MNAKSFVSLIVLISLTSCLAIDLNYTDIYTVTEESRYTTKNPGAQLQPFNKARHAKGNFIFTLGTRIKGDKLILNLSNEAMFARPENIEVRFIYPAEGKNGYTLTAMEIYSDLTSDDADAYVLGGGIDQTWVDVLLTCDQTKTFTYELFYYGY